ncbi:MAG: hypothetical protein U0235_18040 [Polyangiaceae bacterium]
MSEAQNVWLVTLGDAHRAARVLMAAAVDKDRRGELAADRLASSAATGRPQGARGPPRAARQGAHPLAAASPSAAGEARHAPRARSAWNEPPLSQPRKALESASRVRARSAKLVRHLPAPREILKSLGSFEDLPALRGRVWARATPARRVALLLRDEAESRAEARRISRACRATLAKARQDDQQAASLQQEYAASVLDRIHAGHKVSTRRTLATDSS